jgi:hypothetical protein
MDYVMRYQTLKEQAASPRSVGLLAVAALSLFTTAAGIAGTAGVSPPGKPGPYAIRITATRAGGAIAVAGAVRENATQTLLASPALTLDASRRGSARSSAPGGLQVAFDARPEGSEQIAVEVTIEKAGKVVQRKTLVVTPGDARAAADPAREFTGDPIDLSLTDADLREVLSSFGGLTGLEVRIADDIQGRITASWHNVPWDEAFDSILRENGLTYRIEGSTIHVSKRFPDRHPHS